MKITDFLSEWNDFTKDSGVVPLPITDKIALFQHWVTIRKDVAAQQVRNKFWLGLSEGLIKRLKDLVEKANQADPSEKGDTIKEMLEGLEKAMEEHRKNNPS